MENSRAKNDFSRLLKKYRQDAGLSINRLGRLAGIDPTHISRLEKPSLKISPNKRTVLALINALKLSKNDKLILLQSAGYEVGEEDKTIDSFYEFHSSIASEFQLQHPFIKKIIELYNDAELSPDQRKLFRTYVEKYAIFIHNKIKDISK